MKRWHLAVALLLALAGPAAAVEPTSAPVLDGVPVIDALDASKLAPGHVYRFWFRAGDNAIAQGWDVPVVVVKGARPGPRLLLTAGIHGDELNGIAVIQRLTARLDPATLRGTVVAVPGLNTPGLERSSREFPPDGANLNRVMPGDAAGSASKYYAYRLWSRLLRPNADAAVDLHTQSRGTAYVLYAFASTSRARRMAELVGPDIIKLDPGERGTVENEMVADGVPAITFELGRPEVFDEPTIARAIAGLGNLMIEMGMLDGQVAPSPVRPFTGNKLEPVRAPVAGWMNLLAPLGSDIAKGQPLAIITDAFGRTIATVLAPVAGRINTIATDPRRERGDMIARIVFWDEDPKCRDGC